MTPEEEEKVRGLEAEIVRLNGRVKELEPLQKKVADAEAERDQLRTTLADATHGRAFDKIAVDLGVRPDARDDVWKLLNFKADGDVVDEKALREKVAAFVKDRPWTVGESKAAPKRLPKDELASKGGDGGSGSGRRSVTREELRDPEFTGANAAWLSDSDRWEIVD